MRLTLETIPNGRQKEKNMYLLRDYEFFIYIYIYIYIYKAGADVLKMMWDP